MNTGRKIETKRLNLLPGVNMRDSKPFLKMLREDGDFQGYCEEACKAVIKQIFGEGLSADHNQITVDRLYATILAENTPAVELLKKIGFHGDNPEDGPILVMQEFLDEDKDINICSVIKMIYEEKSMCT